MLRYDVIAGPKGPRSRAVDEIEAYSRSEAERTFRERRISRGYPADARLVHIHAKDPGPPKARFRRHGVRARVAGVVRKKAKNRATGQMSLPHARDVAKVPGGWRVTFRDGKSYVYKTKREAERMLRLDRRGSPTPLRPVYGVDSWMGETHVTGYRRRGRDSRRRRRR